MHETPPSAGCGPSTFPAWSRAGARPAQTVRTGRGPSIPHRLRAASRAADVGSHGYRLSLQTGRQGSEVAHRDAKCVGCRENRSGCRISAWGRRRAGHRHGGRSAGETSDTTDAPRGGPRPAPVKDAEGTREPQKPWRVCESSTFPGCATRASPPANPFMRCEPARAARPDAHRKPKEPESRGNPGVCEPAAPQTNLVLRECVMEVGADLDFLRLRAHVC